MRCNAMRSAFERDGADLIAIHEQGSSEDREEIIVGGYRGAIDRPMMDYATLVFNLDPRARK